VASDLRRAWETAEILALPHDLRVQKEPRLRELHFGDWEGLTYAEVRQRDPIALAVWQENPLRGSPPGGESLAGLVQRVRGFLDDIRIGTVGDESPLSPVLGGEGRGLLLVAHRGSLRALLCLLLGRPVERHWDFRLDVASLTEVAIVGGQGVLVRLNETPADCEVGHDG
jgi:broad specificity phosphatase PhoE